MNIVQARNCVLNDEYRTRQEIRRENDNQNRFYDKYQRQLDAITLDHNTENSRLLGLQRRIWDTESSLGIPCQAWNNKASAIHDVWIDIILFAMFLNKYLTARICLVLYSNFIFPLPFLKISEPLIETFKSVSKC